VYYYQLHNGDAMLDIRICRVSGTGHPSSTDIVVRAGCPYGKFLSALDVLLTEEERPPWIALAQELAEGAIFHRDAFRVYLCPDALSTEDLDAMCAIAACDNTSINQVLQRVYWGDWFKDVPISQMLPHSCPMVS
jgi:hypothetical protein